MCVCVCVCVLSPSSYIGQKEKHSTIESKPFSPSVFLKDFVLVMRDQFRVHDFMAGDQRARVPPDDEGKQLHGWQDPLIQGALPC